MPLLKISFFSPMDSEAVRERLLHEGTRAVGEVMEKPERFVMVLCEREQMAFGDATDPCAYLELRSIGGLDDEVNAALSKRLCSMMREVAEVPEDRVFINFVDMARANWGWNGGTFSRPRGL